MSLFSMDIGCLQWPFLHRRHNAWVSAVTVSPLAGTLGFVPLPPLFWLYLAIMLLGYAILTQLVKTWFIRRFGE